MMKLKKSDSNRRDKKHLSSQGQSLLFEAEEDALGLLTGEIVPEAVDASASANTKAQKRNSWRSALGFKGRSSAAAAASGSDNKKNGESKKKEKKQKEKKPSGYTLSVTPKHMKATNKQQETEEPSSPNRPFASTSQSKTTPNQTTTPAKETTTAKTTHSRVKPKPEVVSVRKPTLAAKPVVVESKEHETKTAESPGFEVTYQHTGNNHQHEKEVSRMIAPTLSCLSSSTAGSPRKQVAPAVSMSPPQSDHHTQAKAMFLSRGPGSCSSLGERKEWR